MLFDGFGGVGQPISVGDLALPAIDVAIDDGANSFPVRLLEGLDFGQNDR